MSSQQGFPAAPPAPGAPPRGDNSLKIACGLAGCLFFVIFLIGVAAAVFVIVRTAKKEKEPPADAQVAEAPPTPGSGTPCTLDSDCRPPEYCIQKVCRPLGREGEACAYDSDCLLPLTCARGKCAKSAAAAASRSTTPGAPCTTDADCAPPLFCIIDACRQMGELGEKCGKTPDCKSPYVCTAGVCAQSAAPAAPSTPVKAGSTTPGAPCATDPDCAPPLFCIKSTCRPLGKQGDTCAQDYDCTHPLVCAAGKCAQPAGGASAPAPGQKAAVECTVDADCKKKGTEKRYCIVNTCKAARAAAGEACQYREDCQDGLLCVVGVCRASTAGKGESCRSNDDCTRPLLCQGFICAE